MRYIAVLALTVLSTMGLDTVEARAGVPKTDVDLFPIWRAAAAQSLGALDEPDALATAAALTYSGSASRNKAETARAASAALPYAVKAGALQPDNAAISWLQLHLCTHAPGCDIRDAATTMRWVDAENGTAWLPTLAAAMKDADTTEVDRVLADMAHDDRFNIYTNRATVLMFDALKLARAGLPRDYLKSDAARLIEAEGLANASMVPSFSSLINACRDALSTERRDTCIALSKTLQRADSLMAQWVGFAIEKRLMSPDSKEMRALTERRRVLEWRVAQANQYEATVLPWLKSARARSRVAKMRALPREEDVCIAILREHKVALEPPEEHR